MNTVFVVKFFRPRKFIGFSITARTEALVFTGLGQNDLHLFLLFFLLSLHISSDFPFLDIQFSRIKLGVVDFGTNICQLEENWHDYMVYEACLTTSNIRSGSVTHHGDVKALCFFHVSLVEELVE